LRLLKTGSIILLLFAGLAICSLVYLKAASSHKKLIAQRLNAFHSFLQLQPHEMAVKNEENITIFCLGGSTTEFKDELGRDWPSMLEAEMKKESGFRSVDVYNCGRQWYSTQHLLTHYIQNLKHHKPDVIVMMENINDLLHNADFSTFSTGEFRQDYGHFLGPLRNIINYSNFSDLIFTSIKKLWYQEAAVPVETTEFPGLVPFERNLQVIIQLAKADGTLVILMTQPNLYKEDISDEELKSLAMLRYEALGDGKQWSYNTAKAGINAYNEKIRRIAQNEQVILIDLEKAVPKTLDYFYDDVHYKAKAHDVIAEYLSREIKQLLLDNNIIVKNSD
jgi:lysophospholipase L1-like esterase